MARRVRVMNFASDRRGSIGLMAALTLPVIIGCAGVAVDIGMVYNKRSALQGASDLAALAAVSDLTTAEATVRRVLTANGLADAAFTVSKGRYTADPAVSPEARFVAGATPANALAVSSSAESPAYFSSFFRTDDYPVTARSVATRSGEASFAITSELATVDNPVVSSLTSALIGSPIRIGVLDSDHLAKVSLSGADLSKALGAVAGSGTATEPLERTYELPKFFTALADATTTSGQFAAAGILRRLAGDTVHSTVTVRPSHLLSIPDSGEVGVSSPGGFLGLNASVLDLVNASVAPRGQGTSAKVGLTVPGLAAVTVQFFLQEPPQTAGPIAAGQIGTVVHTAQLKARIKVALGNPSGQPVKLLQVELPIEIVVAGGQAELVGLSCSGDPAARTATLKVTPGVAKVEIAGWVGALAQATLEPSPNRARIAEVGDALGIPLLRVTGRSDVSIVNQTAKELTFTAADVEALRSKTVSTRDFSASLAASLAKLDLRVDLLGLPLGLFKLLPSPSEAAKAVSKAIASAGVTGPIDKVIDAILDVAGVEVGRATVRVTRIDCNMPRIAG